MSQDAREQSNEKMTETKREKKPKSTKKGDKNDDTMLSIRVRSKKEFPVKISREFKKENKVEFTFEINNEVTIKATFNTSPPRLTAFKVRRHNVKPCEQDHQDCQDHQDRCETAHAPDHRPRRQAVSCRAALWRTGHRFILKRSRYLQRRHCVHRLGQEEEDERIECSAHLFTQPGNTVQINL